MAVPIYEESEQTRVSQESSPPPVPVPEEQEQTSSSFLGQLVRELVGVWDRWESSNGQLQQQETNSIRASSSTPTQSHPLPDLICCHHNNNNNNDQQDTFGLSLDIKMEIDFAYQRIGRDLRQIADGYEQTNRRRRRRHPAGSKKSCCCSLNFTLKIVIPVTFLGVTLALLKKNS